MVEKNDPQKPLIKDDSGVKAGEVVPPSPPGAAPDSPPSQAELVRKETAELKAANDAYEAEKLRAETAKAEKIHAGRGEIVPPPEPDTKEQLAEKFERGEVDIIGGVHDGKGKAVD